MDIIQSIELSLDIAERVAENRPLMTNEQINAQFEMIKNTLNRLEYAFDYTAELEIALFEQFIKKPRSIGADACEQVVASRRILWRICDGEGEFYLRSKAVIMQDFETTGDEKMADDEETRAFLKLERESTGSEVHAMLAFSGFLLRDVKVTDLQGELKARVFTAMPAIIQAIADKRDGLEVFIKGIENGSDWPNESIKTVKNLSAQYELKPTISF